MTSLVLNDWAQLFSDFVSVFIVLKFVPSFQISLFFTFYLTIFISILYSAWRDVEHRRWYKFY